MEYIYLYKLIVYEMSQEQEHLFRARNMRITSQRSRAINFRVIFPDDFCRDLRGRIEKC
jgi:hypothetical protein